MGTPDPANLSLGAGEVLFDRFDSSGNSTGYRHLGNVESLNGTPTIEKITKKSSMDGARGTYKEAVIGSELDIVIVLDEYDPENLALALMGDTAAYAQSADSALVAQPVNGGVAIKFDRWYQMELSAGGDAKQVSMVVIKQTAVTLVLNDDYVLNTELGLVKILSTGSTPPLEAVTTWEGDVAAITSTVIRGLSVGKIEGRLKYFSATNQAAGPRFEVDVHKVSFTPEGELGFISEEFGTFSLSGKAQKDVSKPAGEEFFVARKL